MESIRFPVTPTQQAAKVALVMPKYDLRIDVPVTR
jgi:hypothetical protein